MEDIVASEFGDVCSHFTRLNHGSFGCAPKCVRNAADHYRQEWERQPDEMYYTQIPHLLYCTRRRVADAVNAKSVDQIALIDNATVGASIVAHQLLWEFLDGKYTKGDIVVLFEWAYSAVLHTFQSILGRVGARIELVKLSLPLHSPSEITNALRDKLTSLRSQNPTHQLALVVFDHVNSYTGAIFPVEELIQISREQNAQNIFIDGAHSVGQLPIDMQKYNVEYYTSNFHKWGFAPTSVAFFYAAPHIAPILSHPIVSHNYGQGIGRESQWIGTRDCSPFLAVTDALDFIEKLGGMNELITQNHNTTLKVSNFSHSHLSSLISHLSSLISHLSSLISHLSSHFESISLVSLLPLNLTFPYYRDVPFSLKDGVTLTPSPLLLI
jgi:L-cysteine desulfhydrase